MSIAICWFRDDLRVHDNPVLVASAQAAELVCVYCLDPRLEADTSYGPAKLGPHRRGFLREALIDLRERLRALGNELVVVAGQPADVLPRLAADCNADALHVADIAAPEERAEVVAVGARLAHTGLVTHESGTVYVRHALPFELCDMPRAFTPFRKAVEAESAIAMPLEQPFELPPPVPSAIPNEDALPGSEDWPATATPFAGGETAGLARLDAYLWHTRAVAHYKQTRNQLMGRDFSSKLSPWLARGCLSPRQVMAELARFERDVTANESTYWLGFELLWREFFHWTLYRHGARLFALGGLLGRNDRPTARDAGIIQAWQQGRTGMPFVDANMRELAATGYMSNRGRQNAASFFARDLGQDWRVGAAWFEAQLVDYDVASNWGNWANVAGVGTDKRDRGFNILAQARRYDADAAYVSHWLPALQPLAPEDRHTPFAAAAEDGATHDYPPLIIEPPDYWHA